MGKKLNLYDCYQRPMFNLSLGQVRLKASRQTGLQFSNIFLPKNPDGAIFATNADCPFSATKSRQKMQTLFFLQKTNADFVFFLQKNADCAFFCNKNADCVFYFRHKIKYFPQSWVPQKSSVSNGTTSRKTSPPHSRS